MAHQSDRWYSSSPQIYWAAKTLLAGRSIRHRTEICEPRGLCLGAVVHGLKSEFGWSIMTVYRGPENVIHCRHAPCTAPHRLGSASLALVIARLRRQLDNTRVTPALSPDPHSGRATMGWNVTVTASGRSWALHFLPALFEGPSVTPPLLGTSTCLKTATRSWPAFVDVEAAR